jgi:hypothetical protein
MYAIIMHDFAPVFFMHELIVQCLFSWTKTHDQITYCLKHASNTSLCKQIGMFRLLVICSLHKTQVCVIDIAARISHALECSGLWNALDSYPGSGSRMKISGNLLGQNDQNFDIYPLDWSHVASWGLAAEGEALTIDIDFSGSKR